MLLLDEKDRFDLRVELMMIGLQAVFVSESGSKAWGTDTEASDHDFTVVAHDIDYDVFRWPRDSFTQKITFKGKECDVRVFSVAKFLRKLQKSVLVGYESVHSPFIYLGNSQTQYLLRKVTETCFDPREMYRSTMGSMNSVKETDPAKRRRQLFRYMFVALQLLDYRDGLIPWHPKVNVVNYLNTEPQQPSHSLVDRLFKWAMAESPAISEEQFAQSIIAAIYATDFPKMVDFKQDTHRAFLNTVFAEIMEENPYA